MVLTKVSKKRVFFSVSAIPLGPNICLLEESVKGDLDSFLREASEWKQTWLKDIRQWKSTDAECSRSIWVSIFRNPCFMRKTNFVEEILSDIGTLANPNSLDEKTERFDVLKVMIFTYLLGPIRRKLTANIDGEAFSILVVEETSVTCDRVKKQRFGAESESFEDFGDDGGDSNSLSASEDVAEEASTGDGDVRERSVMVTNRQGKYGDVIRDFTNLGNSLDLTTTTGNREAICLGKEGSLSELKSKKRHYDIHSLDSSSRVGCTFDCTKARLLGEEEDKDMGGLEEAEDVESEEEV